MKSRETLVALVRATPKGKQLELAGKPMGVKGRDGRKFYHIHKKAVGKWTCSCPHFRFKRGRVGVKKCKHLLHLWCSWKRDKTLSDQRVTIINAAAF